MQETAERLKDADYSRFSDEFYVTTYCNFPHRKVDGEPIDHECVCIHPAALAAEYLGVEDWVEVFHYIQRTKRK